MVTTRPPKTIVKPTALGPVANTDTKLLIYGLFQKGRVLAQDGVADGAGWSYPVSVKGGPAFWRKSSNRKFNGDSGGFEFRAFFDFFDAYTGFAKRLFYALSGFNHDANFVPSSSPTVI